MMALQQERGSTSYTELHTELAQKTFTQLMESKTDAIKWSRLPGQVSRNKLQAVFFPVVYSSMFCALHFVNNFLKINKYKRFILPGVSCSKQTDAFVPWWTDGLLCSALLS